MWDLTVIVSKLEKEGSIAPSQKYAEQLAVFDLYVKIVLGICSSSLKVIELLTGEISNLSCWQQEGLVRNFSHHCHLTDFL